MAGQTDAAARLNDIAAAMGCSVESLYAPADSDSMMAVELFRLWDAVPDPSSRLRILDTARREAGLHDSVTKVGD